MKEIKFSIKGTTPLMMHNERLANPFDSQTKLVKAVSGKRKKTEDDLLELARLEWHGGLYHDNEIGVHIPGHNALACLIEGGKIHKLGTAIRRAALVLEDKLPLQFDGPKEPGALYADKRFVDLRGIGVGPSRVMRCRPIFRTWGLTFTVMFDENTLQRDDIARCFFDGTFCYRGRRRRRGAFRGQCRRQGRR